MEKEREKKIEKLLADLRNLDVFYKRPLLEKLQPQYQNFILEVSTTKGSFIFFPYNSDTIRDYGWGCAWRCIQSIINSYFSLKSLDLSINFEDLFNFFGRKETLLALYIEAFPNEEQGLKHKALMETNFAPHDLSSGWAEPFIGYLCLCYFKMSSELFLINGLPEYHNTPNEIFDLTLVFSEFMAKLLTKMELPVMIDDGIYAMTIVDASKIGEKYKLKMGDPHIKEKTPKESCIYEVILDKEGNQLENSVAGDQIDNMYSKGSFQGVHFKEKKWMVLFPI